MSTPSHDALYGAFLESLDAFGRAGLTSRGDGYMARRPQDPDLLRLIEAVAWFSARTKTAARDGLYDAVTRMAGSALDGLMVPLPAAALLQGRTDDRLVDPVTLPAGTRFQADLVDDSEGGPVELDDQGNARALGRTQRCLLTSLESVTLWPIELADARLRDAAGEVHIDLDLAARVPQRGARSLPFHVHRVGSYEASVALHTALRDHTRSIVAITDAGETIPCAFTFDSADRPGRDDRRDPIVRVRSFFQFPEQALGLTVDIPAPSQAWRRLTLRLALGGQWPARNTIVDETFRLFTVPVVNAWPDFARPVAYDGTQDTVMLGSSSALNFVRATEVRGVYRASRDMEPVLPFCIGLRERGYEVVYPADRGSPIVRVRLPTAFEAPEKLMIDTVWSQPDLWLAAPSNISVELQDRAVQGAEFHLSGDIHLPVAGPLAGDPELTLDLLALRARRGLDLRALRGLMRTMGATGTSPYAGLPDQISRVELGSRPEGRAGGSDSVSTYTVSIVQPPGGNEGLLRCFGEQISAVLRGFGARELEVHITPVPQAMRAAIGVEP